MVYVENETYPYSGCIPVKMSIILSSFILFFICISNYTSSFYLLAFGVPAFLLTPVFMMIEMIFVAINKRSESSQKLLDV